MSSDVSSVTNYFATANEDFSTTTSGVTTSGSNVVNLSSVTGLTNGTIFVGVIEPGGSKEQVFTGTVDTSGSRITGVVWTKGTNVEHASSVSVVDYDTGTAFNMMSAGIQKQHKPDGTHANTITTNTINENTTANGVTIDGLNIKDGVLNTASSVIKSNLEKPHYNCLYFADGAVGQVFGNSEAQSAFTAQSSNAYGITASLGSGSYLTTARDGVYLLSFQAVCIDVTASDFIVWFDISTDNGVSWYRTRQTNRVVYDDIAQLYSLGPVFLSSGTRLRLTFYNGTGNTRFGSTDNTTEIGRIFQGTHFAVTEIR